MDGKHDAAYARQGMRQVTTGLGTLFAGSVDEDDEDSLVYRRPKDPSAAKSAPAPSKEAKSGAPSPAPAPRNAPEYIYATSVPALFHLNATTGAYEQKSSGAIGCVILGSGTAYNMLFYDASKATLCVVPINSELKFSYQPNAASNYVTFTNGSDNWSVCCSGAAQAQELLRQLTVALAHITIHTDAPAATVSCIVTPGEGENVVAAGDDVALGYTLFQLTTMPSAKPTDVLKQPPIASNATEAAENFADATFVTASEDDGGLAAVVVGMRAHERRMVLLPLNVLAAGNEIESEKKANLLAAAAKSAFTLAEVTVLKVTAASPAAAHSQARRESAAPLHSTELARVDDDDDDDDVDERRQRTESVSSVPTLKERMAKVALGARGPDAAPLAVVAHLGRAPEVQAVSAETSKSRAGTADDAAALTLQKPVDPEPTQPAVIHQPAEPKPAVANATNEGTSMPTLAPSFSPTSTAPQPQQVNGAFTPMSAASPFMYPAMYPTPIPFMPSPYGASFQMPYPSATPSQAASSIEGVAENLRHIEKANSALATALAALDFKMDKLVYAHAKSQSKSQVLEFADASENINGSDLSPEESVLAAAKIPDMLQQLQNVLAATTMMQRKVGDKNSKIDELRRKLEAANKEQEELMNRLDHFATVKATAVREATMLRADKSELEDKVRDLTAKLEAALCRADAGEKAASAALAESEQKAAEAAAANHRADAAEAVRLKVSEDCEVLRTKLSSLEAAHAQQSSDLKDAKLRESQLQASLQQEQDEFTARYAALKAETEAQITDLKARADQGLAEMKSRFQREALAAIEAAKKEGKQMGFDDGFAQGQIAGKKLGFEEGEQTGRAAGFEAGKLAGVDEGYAKGKTEGYISGEGAGTEAGYAKGFATGIAEGEFRGRAQGYQEGFDAGAASRALQQDREEQHVLHTVTSSEAHAHNEPTEAAPDASEHTPLQQHVFETPVDPLLAESFEADGGVLSDAHATQDVEASNVEPIHTGVEPSDAHPALAVVADLVDTPLGASLDNADVTDTSGFTPVRDSWELVHQEAPPVSAPEFVADRVALAPAEIAELDNVTASSYDVPAPSRSVMQPVVEDPLMSTQVASVPLPSVVSGDDDIVEPPPAPVEPEVPAEISKVPTPAPAEASASSKRLTNLFGSADGDAEDEDVLSRPKKKKGKAKKAKTLALFGDEDEANDGPPPAPEDD